MEVFVYCLTAEKGKVVFERSCKGIGATSPAVGGENPTAENGKDGYIYVPLQRGIVQIFSIESNGLSHWFERGIGAATSRPLITDDSVSWPTVSGHYNVAFRFARDRGLAYRLRAYSSIMSPGKYFNGSLYVTSLDGFLYALNEKTGELRWDFSTGEEISQSAIPIDDSVYIITDEKELYRLDYLTGIPSVGWESPLNNIDRFISKSKNRLYLTDTLGRLVALDLKTKQVLANADIGQVSFIIPNLKTDRLYLGYGNGRLQCLREIGSQHPHFHSAEITASAVKEDKPGATEKAKPVLSEEDDPFKGYDSEPSKKGSSDDGDPFGSDPFGSGSSSGSEKKDDANDDPFGG